MGAGAHQPLSSQVSTEPARPSPAEVRQLSELVPSQGLAAEGEATIPAGKRVQLRPW